MILPLIIRTTEEALMSVPDSYREGSFGLGAGKLTRCSDYSALCGTRHTGRRDPGNRQNSRRKRGLIFTAGTVAQVPGSL